MASNPINFHAVYQPALQRWEVLDHLRKMYYEIDRFTNMLPAEIVNVSTGDVRRDAHATLKSIEILRGKLIEAMFAEGLSPVRDAEAIRGPLLGWPLAESTPMRRPTHLPIHSTPASRYNQGAQPLVPFNNSTAIKIEMEDEFNSMAIFSPLGSRDTPSISRQEPPSWEQSWDVAVPTAVSDPGTIRPRGPQTGEATRFVRVQRVSNLAQLEQTADERQGQNNPFAAPQRGTRSHSDSETNYKSFL